MLLSQFLSEDMFVSKPLSILLLSLHLLGLVFFCIRWLNATKTETGKRMFLFDSTNTSKQQQLLSPIYITSTLFTSNYIGICFARTLHYQFYSWYFHSLPFLLWCNTTISSIASSNSAKLVDPMILYRIILLVAIEMAFLTFPATPTSSAVLQLAHGAILWQIQPPNVLLHAPLPSMSTESPLDGNRSKTQLRRIKEE